MRSRGSCRAGACAVALAAALLGCEPADEPGGAAGDETGASPESTPVGGPADDVPETLEELLERTDAEASRWQHGARASELEVDLGEAADRAEAEEDTGPWEAARVTYVAPDAERLLVVTIDGGEAATDAVRLDSLGLSPLPGAAVDELPAPQDLPTPAALAERGAERFGDCDVDGDPAQVRLLTGAPTTWGGDGWSQPPEWQAVVTGPDGDGVRLPTEDGAAEADDPCVAAPPEADPDAPADPEEIEPEPDAGG